MLSITRNGVEYSLDDNTICRFISDDGTGMLPMHRLSERGPLQHGISDLGYYYDPRIIMLTLAVHDTTSTAVDVKRLALMNVFAPQTDPLILKYTLPGGDVRCIDCHFVDGLEMPHSGTGLHFKTALSLKCPDPPFYNPVAESAVFAIGGGDDVWEVPFEVPFEVGASVIDSDIAITYDGNVSTYPVIRITGPAQNAVMTNDSLGLKLDFTGTTIAAADYYEIDLRYGRKTVTDLAGDDKLADLTTDSDIAQWRIAADPDAPGGINSINFYCIAATAATEAALTFYERFTGI